MLAPFALQYLADLAAASAHTIRGEKLTDAQLAIALAAVHHVPLKNLDPEDRAAALAHMVVACRGRWVSAKSVTQQFVPREGSLERESE